MVNETLIEKKISIIKEVASAITSTNNIDSITSLILDLALDYTQANIGSIFLLDKKGRLVIKASKSMGTDFMQGQSMRPGEDICGYVAKEKVPLLVKDINSDERFKNKGKGKYRTSSFICFPIMIKNRLLGVINIADKIDGSSFTEDDADLIDILTSQTAMSLENAHLMSELRLKALELDERNKKLIDSDRLKTEFVARMCHEIRTPLNSINGASYYLRGKKVARAEQRKFIDIISDETRKLIKVLADLLNFTELEKEELFINKRILNLTDILQTVTESKIVQEALSFNKLSFKIKSPEYLSDIIGEKIHLIQSFIYLIEGITKYTESGDTIEVRLTDKDTSVSAELFIKGRTISESEFPFIFDERSIWSESEVSRDKLKLYLAKMIIDWHNGAITVSNTPRGLSFMVVFQRSIKEYRDTELDELTRLFLSFISESMNIRKCSLMLADAESGELIIRSALGIDKETMRTTRLKFGDKIAGMVAAENRPLLVSDIEKDPRVRKKSEPRYNTKSLLCLPVVINGKVAGVLNLNDKINKRPFDRIDLLLASIIMERLSRLIDKVQKGDLENSDFKTTVSGMETLINAARRYQKKNGKFMDLIYKTMQRMERSEDEIKLALYASELYDLGLTQIDESILMKTDDLTPIEKKIIRTHPFPSVSLIDYIETDDAVKKIILHHHERYDGAGYPYGLKGDDIPLTSRILAVIDAYSAMTSNRPYRKALKNNEAIKQIKAAAGTQFDPTVVNAFTHII